MPDQSFRSTDGAPRRTPATPRRRPSDDKTYGVWVESDNSDRGSRCVENNGSKRTPTPPAQFALHSGWIGGATKLATQGMSELQIQRAGRWNSRAFMVYVRDAGEGAQGVSVAFAREG